MKRNPISFENEIPRECLVCGSREVDTAHVKTHGSGGSLDPMNLMDLCRTHHVEQHKIGIVTFFEKYPGVKESLSNNGWKIVDLFGLKKLRRE